MIFLVKNTWPQLTNWNWYSIYSVLSNIFYIYIFFIIKIDWILVKNKYLFKLKFWPLNCKTSSRIQVEYFVVDKTAFFLKKSIHLENFCAILIYFYVIVCVVVSLFYSKWQLLTIEFILSLYYLVERLVFPFCRCNMWISLVWDQWSQP